MGSLDFNEIGGGVMEDVWNSTAAGGPSMRMRPMRSLPTYVS